jgi:hypothetical protein
MPMPEAINMPPAINMPQIPIINIIEEIPDALVLPQAQMQTQTQRQPLIRASPKNARYFSQKNGKMFGVYNKINIS